MTTSAPQGIELASASKFCDFSAREGSPTAIFHELFEISNFAPDLGLTKFYLKRIFLDTPAQPKPSTHISQQSDGRSQTIVRIQSSNPKREENAPKFCSPNFCFEALAPTELLRRWLPKPSLQVIYN